MKLAIIFNRYHTSMLCKRAPVHLQCYATSTGTSNSTSSMLCYEHRYIEFYIFNAMLQAPVHRIQGKQKAPVHQRKSDQISNTSIYSEQIHISTNHNTFRQFIPANLQFCYFKFRPKNFWICSSFPPVVGRAQLYLNFSLNQRDNTLLVTFLNQSSTHWLVYLLHLRVRVTALGLRSSRERNLAQQNVKQS